ncbi:MAG: YggS family pyridoxal phosphate-dependent enzyme [Melioribacteraceae bacterium]|nr:YggS family pyridoxal phosphate-dependent enzyme [Melioribacteraceae bacterium]
MYELLKKELALQDVKLVAVSKTKPDSQILDLYERGQLDFGENRVQDLREKYDRLPKDIRWHMIGHLQRNKVKYIAPYIYMIHSVDNLELLKTIDHRAEMAGRVIKILLQFKIGVEETKHGLKPEEARILLENPDIQSFDHVEICGVMGMASFTDNEQIIRDEFKRLKSYFEELKDTYFPDFPEFKEISMGMSADYKIAIEEGATMVRIGSLIFGPRN